MLKVQRPVDQGGNAMKIKPHRLSTALAVTLVAVFALSGSALAYSGQTSAQSAHHGKIKLRFGKFVDTDTTANDGSFNYAHGHANCKHGERLISGGLRWHHGSITAITGHFAMVESGPVKREWRVTASSDMGGAARQDFLVVASCEVR
jgi:hypothetical protein